MGRATGKRGQEEIVGFVMIVVIVSVILLFLLVFFISSDKGGTNSPKAASFLQAALAYTSNCGDNSEFLDVEELIVSCYNEERCDSGEYSCNVLNETLSGLLAEAWQVGEELPNKGYKMDAVSGSGAAQETLFSISAGNVTSRFKGSPQIIPSAAAQIKVTFTAYN